ncbi:MAG: DUF4272 domain-containing protein [Ferruginibacter sp.]
MGIFNIFKNNANKGSKTAAQRKQATEKLLKSAGIPFIDHLPLLEEESEVKIRTAREIAERILVLTYLGYIAEVPGEGEVVINFLKQYSLWDKASPAEKELFQKEKLTKREAVDISWRCEAAWLLLWVIGKTGDLELPVNQVEIGEIIERLPEFLDSPAQFIESAAARPASEILDIADLTYRLHWAARNADLKKQPQPAGLNLSVIMERHHAINWVTFYGDEWDEITTDT